MVFEEVTPTKTRIEWNVLVKPKTCGSYFANKWMAHFYKPLHKEHFAANLRFQINKKYYADVEAHIPGKRPTHSNSIRVVKKANIGLISPDVRTQRNHTGVPIRSYNELNDSATLIALKCKPLSIYPMSAETAIEPEEVLVSMSDDTN